MIAAICVGVAVFVVVWTLGEVLWVHRPRLSYVPSPELIDEVHQAWSDRAEDRCRDLSCTCNQDRAHAVTPEYVEFVSPLGDAQGIIRVPRDIAHLFDVPDGWAPRVEETSS